MMDGILSRETGRRILAMGNEAVARGALEAGMGYFATYPGTPASEIGDTLIAMREYIPNLYAEYSANEHVALHGAIGASFSGIRSMAAMKHVGMNVAAEPLHFLGLTGVLAGLVVVIGSDPGVTCSTTEQDDRWYSLHTHAPILEPSDIQEAKDFTKEGFRLSEQFDVPIILNVPSRLAHNTGDLILGDMPEQRPSSGHFVKNPVRYFNLFHTALDNHRRVMESMDRLREYSPQSPFNRVLPGSADWGIITSSVNYGYLLEALDLLGLYDLPILKIGLTYPVSPALVADFLSPLKGAIIVEDLEGFLEFQIKKVAYDLGLRLPLKGKGLFPPYGELNVDLISQVLAREFGGEERLKGLKIAARAQPIIEKLPPRTGAFCAGCPHRATIYSLMKATRRQEVYGGDIGCLTLSGLPPHYASDWVTCMNCGLATSQGVSKMIDDQKVITIVGDSTFFHSGVPALVNAVQ
jgi:indolepyruvate ferredoxin oxidoreductase alpha subunit